MALVGSALRREIVRRQIPAFPNVLAWLAASVLMVGVPLGGAWVMEGTRDRTQEWVQQYQEWVGVVARPSRDTWLLAQGTPAAGRHRPHEPWQFLALSSVFICTPS
jgi:hypothetical protein